MLNGSFIINIINKDSRASKKKKKDFVDEPLKEERKKKMEVKPSMKIINRAAPTSVSFFQAYVCDCMNIKVCF